MKSRRSWLLGLALGAALSLGMGSQSANAQYAVRQVSYQALVKDNGGQLLSGTHTFDIDYFLAGGGSPVFSERQSGIVVADGIVNLLLGNGAPGNQFPASMPFNVNYWVQVTMDKGTAQQQTWSSTIMVGAPYALDAQRVNNIEASATPENGKLWPVPVTGGKIDPSVLPTPPNFVATINGVTGDANNNLQLIAGNNVTITNSPANHTITIDATAGGGASNIIAGPGLTGGGPLPGNVTISLATGGITNQDIGDGAITGRKLDSHIYGNGLVPDAFGNINVNPDNSTIEINNNQVRVKPGGITTVQLADGSVTTNKLADGAVTAAKVDPTQVQLRVNGVAPNGSFVVGVNQNGTVNSGTVNVDATLNRTISGPNLNLGINLANPNTWTGAQSFSGGATASTLNVTGATTTNGITNTGTFTNNGNATISGSLGVGTLGTDANVVTINGLNGGLLTELRVFGDANITGTTTVATENATTINATTVNTTNLGGNPNTSPITLLSGLTAGTQAISGGVFSGYQLNNGTLNTGMTLTNNGTINGGALTNNNISGAAITASTINSTTIGATTPSSAVFTTLRANSTSDLVGLATVGGTVGGADGNKMVINGQVSPTPVTSGQFELVVNGDAQVTGTLSAGNIVTPSGTIGAPHGKFDDLDVFTPSNTAIKLLTAFDMQNHNILNVGTFTQTSGTATLLNTTVNGTLSSTGTTSIATTSGNVAIGNSGGTNTINGATGLGGTTFNSGATFNQPVQLKATGNIVGPLAPADGNYMTINGGVGGATELVVNGDISFTGNLTGGPGSTADFTSLKTDNFASHTPAGNINVNSPIAMSGTNGISTVSGNFTSTSGSFNSTTGGVNVGGNSNIATNNGTTTNIGTGVGSFVNVGSSTSTNVINGTDTFNGNVTINGTGTGSALTTNGGLGTAITATASGSQATMTLAHTGGTGHTLDVTSGDVHLGGTSAPANLNTTTVNNLTVEGNLNLTTGTFNVLTAASPAITGKSTQDLGIGVRGISRPTSPNAPGAGIFGLALDNSSNNGAAESNTNPLTGNVSFAGVNSGVMGVASNDSYFGGAFFNTNQDNPNAINNVATALLARASNSPANATTGRGILVEQLTSGNSLATGIEVRNTSAASTLTNGIHINSNGGSMTTGLLIDPPVVGIEDWSNTDGATFNSGAGPLAGTTGVRIGTKSAVGLAGTLAANAFETGARIDGGTTGVIIGGTSAPTFGEDINFVGSALPTYGVRINSTVAGAGAGIIVGNTGYTQEGGVFNAGVTGVRIGTNFNGVAGTAPFTGIQDNVVTNGTGMNITGVTTGTGINAQTLTTGTGLNMTTTSGTGVNLATQTGTGYNYTASGVGTAVNATTPGGVGLNVNAGAANGVVVTTPTTNGVNLVAMGAVTGVNYAGTSGTALNVTKTAGGNAVNINQTGGGNGVNIMTGVTNGVVIDAPATNGVLETNMAGATGVNYTGTTGNAVSANTTTGSGLYMTTVTGTGLNYGASGAGTGANITTVGGLGVNVTPGASTGLQVTTPTTTGVSLVNMGNVTGVSYIGTTGTGFNYAGAGGTGMNVQSGASTGVWITSPTLQGVNLATMGAVTGVNYTGTTGTALNVTTVGGKGLNVNAGSAVGVDVLNATTAGVRVDNSTSNVVGVTSNGGTAAGLNGVSTGQNLAAAAPTVAASVGTNNAAPGATNGSTVGVLGKLGTTTVTGSALNALWPALNDFSAGVYGDGSNAVAATARPGVIAVTNSATRGAIEAFNTGGGPAASLYGTGITLMATTSGNYPVATAIEGRSTGTTSGVGMVGLSNTPIGTATAGAGLLGILTGSTPSNEAITGMYAGVVGTTGVGTDVTGGHDIGVIGADQNTATVGIAPGTAARIGLYGISGGAGANDAAVRAEDNAAGGRGIQVVSTNAAGANHGIDVTITGSTATPTTSYGVGIDMSGGAGSGLYIKGTGVASGYVPATGTGIYVDPVNTGIVSVANTIGAELMSQTDGVGLTGLNIGQVAANRFITGANVRATSVGLNVAAPTTGISVASNVGNNAIDITSGNLQLANTSVIQSTGTAVTINDDLTVGTTPATATTIGATNGTITSGSGIVTTPGDFVIGSATVPHTGNAIFQDGNATGGFHTGSLRTLDLSANQTYDLPDLSGTVAVFPPSVGGFVYLQPTTAQLANAAFPTNPLINIRGLATTPDGVSIDLATNPVTGAASHSLFTGNITNGAGVISDAIVSGIVTATNNAAGSGASFLVTASGVTSSPLAGVNALVTGNTSTGAIEGGVFNVTGGNGGAVRGLRANVTATAAASTVTGLNMTATAAGGAGTSTGALITANGSTTSDVGVNVTATGSGIATSTGYAATVTGQAPTGLSATVTSSGANSTGASFTVSGAATNNVGVDISASGTGVIGERINGNSAGSSIGVDISAVNTGVRVANMSTVGSSTAFSATLSAGTANQTGLSVNMNGAVGGANGIAITGSASATSEAIAMSGSGGTGISITSIGSGTGLEALSVSGNGTGVSAQYTGTGTGVAINSSSSSTNAGSAAARLAGANPAAPGTLQAAALQVTQGGISATNAGGPNFADTYTLSLADQGVNSFSVSNNLVTPTSTIIVSYETNGGAVGWMNVTTKGAGTFTVNTTAANFANVTRLDYIIINH